MTTEIFEDVSLVVDGQEHKGWQGVQIVIAIDALARTFTLQMSYDTRGDFPAIYPGAPCEIYVNGFKRITGFIDDIDSQKTNNGHTRAVTGRSKTRNIIDSSIHLKTNQMNNVTLFELCRKLAEPFGINVINEAGDLPKIPIVRWADGTRVGRLMQDEARKIGVTVRDNENGDIVLTRPSDRPSRAAIAEGSGGKNLSDSNMESWRVVRSEQARFSHYIAKGRSTQKAGKQGNQRYGEYQDEGVTSFRPLIIKAEGDVTNAICKQRAAHEAQRRLGQSYQVSCTVSGWRHTADKEPWEVDEIVPISIPTENVQADMIVRRIVHRKNSGGTHTDIELVDERTFTALPSGVRGGGTTKVDVRKYITDLGSAESIFDNGAAVTDGDGIAN